MPGTPRRGAVDNRARYLCPDEGHRAGRSSCSESNGQSPNITEQVRCEYSNPQSRIAGSRMPDSGKLADPPSAMFGNVYSMSGSFAIPMSFRFLLFPLADIFPKQRHRPHCPKKGQMQPAPCFVRHRFPAIRTVRPG